jgi:hypothetical protein
MEEKKKQEKLSYEELAKNFGELHLQYQKLVQEYQKAMQALNNRDFDYTSFFLSMLFKVMEHPEMYTDEFVSWTSKHIEDALYSFDKAMNPEEKPDEAE